MQFRNELSRHSVLDTTDLDHARDAMGKIFCLHRLTPGTDVGSGRVRFNHVPIQALSLGLTDYGREVTIEPVPFEKFYILQIIREGRGEITCNGRRFEVKAGQASMLNPTGEMSLRGSRNCRKLIVKIDRAALERFAETWFGHYLAERIQFDNRLAWESADLAAARALVDLIVEDFESEAGVLSHIEAQKHFEQSFFSAILVSGRHSLRHLMKARSPAAPKAVKRAEDYIIAHAAEDITIADLVAASEVPTRTLFESFRRFRGITPMQYLRRYRLDRVREELSQAGSHASVTEVALRWNFQQLGRFSSHYASVFGEKPSETMRNARSGSRMAVFPFE